MEAQTAYLIQVQRASGAGGAGNLQISVAPEPDSTLAVTACALALGWIRKRSPAPDAPCR